MKQVNTVVVRIFHKCDRCGQEESNPQIIERGIDPAFTFDETRERVTVELHYLPENDKYIPDPDCVTHFAERKQ